MIAVFISWAAFMYTLFDGVAFYKQVWNSNHIKGHNYLGAAVSFLTSWFAWPIGVAGLIYFHKKKDVKILPKVF